MPQLEAKQKKTVLVSLLAVLAVSVLALGGWFARKQTSPPMPETVDDIEALFADSRYQSMDRVEQQPYLERVNEMWGSMSQEDRRRLGELLEGNTEAQEEAMNAMVQGMRDFYSGQVRAGNTAMLDGIADQMGEGMAEGMSNAGEMSDEEMEEMRDRMDQFMDSGDPQAMGFGSELMKRMMQRRRDRGLGGF